MAGIVSLLNDARLVAGGKPLGFLNPLLYSIGANTFNDVTVGHNSGCGTTGFNVSVSGLKLCRLILTHESPRLRQDGIRVCNEKFSPSIEELTFEIVTGLGTINFQKLKDVVVQHYKD